ncbi:MAG: ABC transporter permease [Bacteroidales bacterium]|jgi:phospholipid/cholesterol/gamma-HCH transport system permease protein|nr:ABC transporter permease [Bacteroidales bacterium]MDD4214278.1 ABC transporter permease [Bacteroidales bacterium]
MRKVFTKHEKASVFRSQIITEVNNLGLDSLGIVAFISVFMGAVVAIQTGYNSTSAWIPDYTVGFTTRASIVLEFSPTIICLILAGKVGSRISSEIGTMRVTEQIDALEIMGVNSANFLILPKIVSSVIIFPILVIISMFLGIFGGWFASVTFGIVTSSAYYEGITLDFIPFEIFYSLVKTAVFSFIITSVSGYYGYYAYGGALEVGKASTKAVVTSSILIILFNLLITQIMLG